MLRASFSIPPATARYDLLFRALLDALPPSLSPMGLVGMSNVYVRPELLKTAAISSHSIEIAYGIDDKPLGTRSGFTGVEHIFPFSWKALALPPKSLVTVVR